MLLLAWEPCASGRIPVHLFQSYFPHVFLWPLQAPRQGPMLTRWTTFLLLVSLPIVVAGREAWNPQISLRGIYIYFGLLGRALCHYPVGGLCPRSMLVGHYDLVRGGRCVGGKSPACGGCCLLWRGRKEEEEEGLSRAAPLPRAVVAGQSYTVCP